MNNLSKREKTLMYVLVVLLIIVGGGFLLCLPAFEKYTTLKEEYSNVDAQYMTVKAGVVEYSDLEKKIEDATNAYNEQVSKFYIADETHAEDVDQLITSLSVNHNLKPMSLLINAATDEEVMSYRDYVASMVAKSTTETADEGEEIEAATTTAKVYTVSLTVNGTIANLQALINDASNIKTLKVTDVSYTSQSDSIKSMTISFKVFMI